MTDANSPASTRASRIIKASRQTLSRAFADPAALVAWQVPGEMTGQVHAFDLRLGGGYRMSLFDPASEEGAPRSPTASVHHGPGRGQGVVGRRHRLLLAQTARGGISGGSAAPWAGKQGTRPVDRFDRDAGCDTTGSRAGRCGTGWGVAVNSTVGCVISRGRVPPPSPGSLPEG